MNNFFENPLVSAGSTVSQNYSGIIQTASSTASFLKISDSARTSGIFQLNAEMNSPIAITVSTIETIAQWFLYKSPMSNKKLQKLCYYAYCWFIVFNNDIEAVDGKSINTICTDKFQAWIHGPVCPNLYYKYRENGWTDIPQYAIKPKLATSIENLLEQVWIAYGSFSADELEAISHSETPWKNARKGLEPDEAGTREINEKDILLFYSNLR